MLPRLNCLFGHVVISMPPVKPRLLMHHQSLPFSLHAKNVNYINLLLLNYAFFLGIHNRYRIIFWYYFCYSTYIQFLSLFYLQSGYCHLAQDLLQRESLSESDCDLLIALLTILQVVVSSFSYCIELSSSASISEFSFSKCISDSITNC